MGGIFKRDPYWDYASTCIIWLMPVCTFLLLLHSDRVRNKMRIRRMSKRTEEAYLSWNNRYVFFHRELRGEWVPENMDGNDVSSFLTHLAVECIEGPISPASIMKCANGEPSART